MIDLVIDGLAAYRLTRLVTADSITEGPRRAVVLWAFRREPVRPAVEPGSTIAETLDDYDFDQVPKLATLVTCRWCVGVYVAFAVVAARRLAPRAWGPVAEGLALAAAAALAAGLEG